ncbi:MAG: HDOD domain-containing protein [Rhodoferax sp.]|nr:HDOD domain-containing protein [Rhodoferax sp.]
MMAALGLTEFVAATGHLPLLAGMAAQLVRSVEREDISAAELGRQIAADAVLASHLLRLVNAPYYSRSRRIGSVTDALAVLGFNMVRRISTSVLMLRPLLVHLPDTLATRAFWRHQLLCAGFARLVHQLRQADGEEVAYMAGLLHDVGRLALFVRWPETYAEFLQPPFGDEHTLIAAERLRFGFDHAQAGSAVLHHWNVPEAITTAAGRHADQAAPPEPVADSVWRANRLAHRMAAEVWESAAPAWMVEAGLDRAACRRIVDEVDALASARA